MSFEAVAASVLMGGLVGVASGLLGIGGGLVMVPFLYALMTWPEWSGMAVPLDAQAAMAHATSLVVIVPTALSGLLAFHRRGIVQWTAVVPLGTAAAFAAVAGSALAVSLPTRWLKFGFGVFLMVMAFRTIRSGRPGQRPEVGTEIRWPVALVGGALVGFLSALLGVGGGIVAIPILMRWAGVDIRRVAAASIGIVAMAAPAGVLGYVVSGLGEDGLPGGALGYAFLPAAFAMAPGAVALAPVGARLNQALPTAHLRMIFAFAMIVVGIELVWVNGVSRVFGP